MNKFEFLLRKKRFDDVMYKVLGFFLSILNTFWIAFVSKTIWLWFMVPAGLPEIGMVHALGLRLCCAPYLFYKEEDKYSLFSKQLILFFATLYILGIGWVLRFFL